MVFKHLPQVLEERVAKLIGDPLTTEVIGAMLFEHYSDQEWRSDMQFPKDLGCHCLA